MAVHGKNSALVLGAYDLTEMLNEVSGSRMLDAVEASHFRQSAKEYVVGMGDGTIDLSGLYRGDLAGVEAVMTAAADQPGAPVTIGQGYGLAPGAPARLAKAVVSQIDATSPIGDVVSVSGTIQCDDGLRSGYWLTGYAPSVLTPGVSVDVGAAGLSARAVLHLHVLAGNTHTGGAQIRLQDSTNGTAWVDMIAPLDVAPGFVGAVRVAVGDSTRYVRLGITPAAGTGQQTIIAAIAR